MANSALYCGVCEHRKQSSPASVWCQDCNEGLCESCQEYHISFKLSRDHHSIPITEYLKLPASLKEIKEFCNTHFETFQTYCTDHVCPCCRKCMIETHSKCKFVALEDVIENYKNSSSFKELEESLTEITSNLDKIKSNRVENKERIATQREEITTKIRELRQKINKHLDKLEENLFSELSTIVGNEISKIDSIIETTSEKEKGMLKIQTTIESVKTYASDLQAFLYTKQLEDEVTEIQTRISAMETDGSLHEKEVCFGFDSGIQNIISDVTALGKLKIEASPPQLSLQCKKGRQAQIRKKKDFDSVDIKLQHSLSVSDFAYRYGLTTIPKEGIAYTMFGKKVLVCLNYDGSTRFNVWMKFNPFDVALVDEKTVAVSSGGNPPYLVSLLNLENQTEIKTFELPSYAYGIAVKGRHIFCAVYYSGDKGLYRINIDHGTVDKIKDIDFYLDSYLAVIKDHILYTNTINSSVACCDLNGSTIWTFRNDQILRCPMGITTDDEGLIYVVGRETNNVVILTPDGKSSRQLLSNNDGLDSPSAIHFDRLRNELLVANRSKIFRFSFA